MSVGDFVAVNAYTAQAFQPLNFLGSVYTAVIKVRRVGGKGLGGMNKQAQKHGETFW